MKLSGRSYFKFALALFVGAALALALCVQCIRTYLYTDSVLVPQQAEREAERQGGALGTAARSAGLTDPRALPPAIQHVLDASAGRVLWIRILNPEGSILAQGGTPQASVRIPKNWWERLDKHESLGSLTETTQGKTLVAVLPFRMPHPQGPPTAAGHRGPNGGGALLIEVAIPLQTVHGAFDGLRDNLIVGLIASIALLFAVIFIGLRTPHYLRGKYLEGELQLAKRVQADLQPKPQSIPSSIEFAASTVAADHVGGDFYDIFETDDGKVGLVLGDVSGKGVSAALLVSVIQGAIRSSTVTDLETACERINRMLCERTACERFATLFWGVYDQATGTLEYVNAGHAPPMLVPQEGSRRIQKLDQGGPVLGMLPNAIYACGTVEIERASTLALYSDGINEAANQQGEEFGEARVAQIVLNAEPDDAAEQTCQRIMSLVDTFSLGGAAPDDRTLMLVRFPSCSRYQEYDCQQASSSA